MSSKNFKPHETSCNCNCDQNVDPVVNIILELVRLAVQHYYAVEKVRVIVTSGSRCVEWNKHEDGHKNSEHTYNIACDFKCKYYKYDKWNIVPPKFMHDYLDDLFPDSLGLGVYDKFNHADGRSKKSRWDERTK